jgi:hypothetical protein
MCDKEETSREHVPSIGLFPEQKDTKGKDYRVNLITVPSCAEHNTKRSGDDAYFQFVMLAPFGNNSVAENQQATKLLRTLERNPEIMQLLTESAPALINGEPTRAITVDVPRIERVLDCHARGLYFDEYKTKWNKNFVFSTSALFDKNSARMQSDYDWNIHIKKVGNKFLDERAILFKGRNPEVFKYRIAKNPEETMLIVQMVFYEGVEYFVATLET